MEKLYRICRGLNARFAGNDNPFRIMTRIAEEVGELASEVHHFERVGRTEKYESPPDKRRLAKECMDVLTGVLHVAMYYDAAKELEEEISKHARMVVDEGLVTE